MPSSVHTPRYQLIAAFAFTAVSLAACGGGGGGNDISQPAAGLPPSASAPAPGGPSAASAPIQLTASAVAQSNQQYQVNAAGAGTIDLTLPAQPAVGDVVSISGVSANAWRLIPNAGQTVVTSNLSGNAAPGVSWTPRLNPKVWHWISSDAAGDVLVAGEASGGLLNTSKDGGATWTTGNSTPGIWISSDMTPSGDRIVAAQFFDSVNPSGLYISEDRGATWTQLHSSNPGVTLENQAYESVSISNDGQRIVAAVQNGPIYVSGDGGRTWASGTLAGSPGSFTRFWRALDSSADGLVVVAAEQNGELFRSADGGLTWSPLAITVGGAAISENWYRIQISDDGQVIALVGNSFGGPLAGTGIYVSRDGGASWTKPFALTADYSAIAMSGDGQVITVTVSDPNPNPAFPGTVARAAGRVLRSTDAGATFTALTMPGSDTDWRAVATSADGNEIAAATGLFTTGATGQLYTSLGNRTSVGPAGAISGGQNMSVQVKYMGNGQWSAPASSGGPFAIQ